jgi:hypothetical protein
VSVFGWNYIDGNGDDVGGSQRFDEREAAEDWMGQAWQGLADVGVEHVVLFDHSREKTVYRMGLQAE